MLLTEAHMFSLLHGYKVSVIPKVWEFYAVRNHLYSYISIILLSYNTHFDKLFLWFFDTLIFLTLMKKLHWFYSFDHLGNTAFSISEEGTQHT